MDALSLEKTEESASEKKTTTDRRGNFTLADYMALPEGTRVELIDGVLYDECGAQSSAGLYRSQNIRLYRGK